MEQGAKRASFTVAAANAGSEEEKVLSDETTFRAKVVDENGAPVEGVKLVGKDESFGNEPEFTSNANGVAEYEIEDNDITCIYTIRVSEDSDGQVRTNAHLKLVMINHGVLLFPRLMESQLIRLAKLSL